MVNPHSWIYVDVTNDGNVERWALEGPGMWQAQRRGFDPASIKPGDELRVCGYLARTDVTTTKREPSTDKAARKLSAAVLTTKDGGQFAWNNYRQGKCGLDKYGVRLKADPLVSSAPTADSRQPTVRSPA